MYFFHIHDFVNSPVSIVVTKQVNLQINYSMVKRNNSDNTKSAMTSMNDYQCCIMDFIVHVSCYFLQSTFHCSCFISFPSVHTSLIMFHFYFLQPTVSLIHFTQHCPSCSYLPYLVVFTLHGHSISLSVSLFSQSRLWKLATYKCLQINF